MINITQNGIFDASMFLLLDFLYFQINTRNGNFLDVINKEFIRILFYCFIYINSYSTFFRFTKIFKSIAYLILNISLFLNRKFFDGITNDSIDTLLFMSLFIILSSNIKKLSIGSGLILSETLTKLISTAQVQDLSINNNNSKFYLPIISIFLTHMILLKYLKFLMKNYDKDKLNFWVVSFMFIITLNFHFNQLSLLIISTHARILVDLIIKHNYLIVYWAILLPISLLIIEFLCRKFNLSKINKRKFFHLLALLIYIPGIKFMHKDLLLLISIVILYIFTMIEIFRNNVTSKLSSMITKYLKENIDERDDEQLIITHQFLLFGCFSSILFTDISEQLSLFNLHFYYIGVIVLGVGDSLASIIGSQYGKRKIFPFTNKSLEGTCTATLSTFLVLVWLDKNFFSFKSIIAIILIFIYEGMTLEIDNLVLPIFAFKIFRILN